MSENSFDSMARSIRRLESCFEDVQKQRDNAWLDAARGRVLGRNYRDYVDGETSQIGVHEKFERWLEWGPGDE